MYGESGEKLVLCPTHAKRGLDTDACKLRKIKQGIDQLAVRTRQTVFQLQCPGKTGNSMAFQSIALILQHEVAEG